MGSGHTWSALGIQSHYSHSHSRTQRSTDWSTRSLSTDCTPHSRVKSRRQRRSLRGVGGSSGWNSKRHICVHHSDQCTQIESRLATVGYFPRKNSSHRSTIRSVNAVDTCPCGFATARCLIVPMTHGEQCDILSGLRPVTQSSPTS